AAYYAPAAPVAAASPAASSSSIASTAAGDAPLTNCPPRAITPANSGGYTPASPHRPAKEQKTEHGLLCVVCLDRAPSAMMYCCKSMRICTECADRLAEAEAPCPLCRANHFLYFGGVRL